MPAPYIAITATTGRAAAFQQWLRQLIQVWGQGQQLAGELNAMVNAGDYSMIETLFGLSAGQGQTLSVTFTPTDTTDYSTATASVTLTVNQARPTITWNAPAAITYGTALSATQLDATASVPGTFVYNPAAGTVRPAGSNTLSVTFTPTDTTDYTTTTATVTLIVNRATPTITWAAPAAITYGTALSATQLNATASVPGKFVYSPAAGTILGGGPQTLTTTFTPTDTTDYTTATATVILTVNSSAPAITLVSSASPVFVSNPVTLTATLSSSGGIPTGSVSFYSGTTLLGQAALASGVAAYTTSALTTGTNSVTAVYSGDSNFAGVTSAAASVLVEDFTIASPSGSSSSATAPAGGQAAFLLLVAPQGGSTFPQAIDLTVTGLPAGATAMFSPSAELATGSGSTNVSLTVVLPSSASAAPQHSPFGRELPVALGLILLPFFARVRRNSLRFNKLAGLVLFGIVSAALGTALGGCGGNVKSSQTYTLTVTGTSGSLSHSTTLTLTQR